MVSVVKRPQGHKLIDQAISATASSSFYFDADESVLINFTAHALSDGDFVYVTSDIDEYNGFWEVEVFNANAFYITEGGVRVEFYQEVDVQYYQTQEHDWSAIFLPIIYKISNDRWPTNTVDTARSVSSSADDNGFTDLTLSGVVRASINALEFVKISGASDEDLNGVWQIVEVITTSRLVLSLPYDSANSFSGATVQYYYNNYQVKVKIFAGLNATSPWETKKPYQEVAELSLTPDEDNLVMFSVSDYIQSKVQIKNNLLLYSLPLNLDAFTGFYISTAESYDDSDNYTLFTTESVFTQDTFEGYAVAGKLPFKNLYAGDYADYVYTSGSPARWLTVFDRLLAVEGYFFDVSFIKNIMGTFFLRYTKYITSDYGIVEDVNYADQGIGVYRLPLEINAAYESICIQVFRSGSSGFVPAVMSSIDTWTNVDTGNLAWALVGTVPTIDTNALGFNNTSDDWHTAYAFEAGQVYSFDYTFFGLALITVFHIDIVDASDNVLTTTSITLPTQTTSGTFSFLAPTGAAGITIWMFDPASCGSGGGFCEKRIVAFTNTTTGSGAADAFAITEEICIDILEVCEVEGGFTPEGRRLTEDGGFRLLE